MTQQSFTSNGEIVATGFEMERIPRPVLAREADSTYWMSRYVERVENVARLMLVSVEALLDARDLAPKLLERQWQSVLRIMHVALPPETNEPVSQRVSLHMTFREDNPNSLISCLTRARENARGIREGISSEMWEHVNLLYWNIRADDAKARFNEAPALFLQQLMHGAMTFHGIADATLPHNQRWHFAQLGRYFERIAYTCRTLQDKLALAALVTAAGDAPLRNVQGVAALRCCNSLEAYRRAYSGEVDPTTIAGFLLLEADFPRSIRYCVNAARLAAAAIREEVRPRSVDLAERTLGRLQAQLAYADADEVLGKGLSGYLDQIQEQVGQAALAVQKCYFLH